MPSDALAFFLDSSRQVVTLDLIEISHSAFSQTYYRVRNHRDGVTVILEDGETEQLFEYYPLAITELRDQADLDTGIRIDFGDLGEVLPKELDLAYAADAFDEKPQVIYRAYRSDDLTAPLLGPIILEARSFSFTREGASFEATAPYVNLNRTGESYDLTRFGMLRSLVT